MHVFGAHDGHQIDADIKRRTEDAVVECVGCAEEEAEAEASAVPLDRRGEFFIEGLASAAETPKVYSYL